MGCKGGNDVMRCVGVERTLSSNVGEAASPPGMPHCLFFLASTIHIQRFSSSVTSSREPSLISPLWEATESMYCSTYSILLYICFLASFGGAEDWPPVFASLCGQHLAQSPAFESYSLEMFIVK